jgi:hypothetical protein
VGRDLAVIRPRRRLARVGVRSRGGCASGGRRGARVVRAALAGLRGKNRVATRRGRKAHRGPHHGKGCDRVRIYGLVASNVFMGFISTSALG